MTVLLDTHVLLYWLGADPRLSAAQAEVIRQAGPAEPLWVSDISLWEVVARARTLEDLYQRTLAPFVREEDGHLHFIHI